MFVSPSEPAIFKTIGSSNMLPEEYGADFLWQSELGLVGVQRKQFPSDFLASVHDGRLNEQFIKMKALDVAILMLEGTARWTTEGSLIRDRNDKRNGWSKTQHRNYLQSVQMRGIHVAHTDSLADSVAYLGDLQVWTDKPNHDGLDTRPAATGSGWGRVTNRDYQRYLLQGLPGIGVTQANRILDTLGFPFRLTVGVEEFMTVPGIGKKKAEQLVRVFHG